MNIIAGNTEVNRISGAEDWLEHTVRTLVGAGKKYMKKRGGERLVNGGGRQGQWQHKPPAHGCQNGTSIQGLGAVKTGVRDSV